MRLKTFTLALILVVMFSGCSLLSFFNKIDAAMFEQITQTTPVFGKTGDPKGFGLTKSTKGFGDDDNDPLYKSYYTMRSFDIVADKGVVDRSNLYRLIYDVDETFKGTAWKADTINPQDVVSPFPGIAAGNSYNKAATDSDSSTAFKEEGDIIEALISCRWTESEDPKKDEIGVARFTSNTANGALDIDFAFSVDYDTADAPRTYNMRCKVTGNSLQHSFQFKYRINGVDIIAKGISQGDGQWMLFRYKRENKETYLAVPAGEDYEWFRDSGVASEKTNPDDLPSEVASYKEWVLAETYFTDADLIDSSEDLVEGAWQIGY